MVKKDTISAKVCGDESIDVSNEMLLGNYNGTPSRYTTLLKGILDGCDVKNLYSEGGSLHDGEGCGCVSSMNDVCTVLKVELESEIDLYIGAVAEFNKIEIIFD